MCRRVSIFTLGLILVVTVLMASPSDENFSKYRSKGNEAGYALVDSVIEAFQNMAEAGIGGYKAVNAGLQELMAELKKAKAQKKIDDLFYNRYKRILVIMKLAIIDRDYDREFILGELIGREIQQFALEVNGTRMDLSKLKTRGYGITVVAAAVADELLNLHQYLDGKKYRDDLQKNYQKKILGTK